MRRLWTHFYLSFSLPRESQMKLDVWLRERGTSVGQEFRITLEQLLEQVGIDPAQLERPSDDDEARPHE